MKPFLHGKKTASVAPLRPPVPGAAGDQARGPALPRMSAQSLAASALGNATCATGEASVEVIKEGDKVVRMVVTCRCGERIEIECLYTTVG